MAAWAVVAADVKDEAVSACAEGCGLFAEVARLAEGFQVFGANAEAHPGRWVPAVGPLDHGVQFRADRGIHRSQVAGGFVAELFDHVHRGAYLLVADDLCEHAPGVVAEHLRADSLAW